MKLSDVGARFGAAWDALRGRSLDLRGAYAGAQMNRLFNDWVTSALPSDQELITDLRLLRSRSRSLGRDNPFAVRFLDLMQENVIGPAGIDIRPQLKDESGRPDRVVNRRLHDAWLDFTDRVSIDQRDAMADFCMTGALSLAQDGELFVRKHVGRQHRHGLALQFVDPELVDESYNVQRDPQRGTNEIRLSVEVDRWARRVAYHCYEEPSVWGSYNRGSRFAVPADEMLHVGRSRRIHQTRYVPWFHPVMGALKMLDGLVEAELVASRTAAAKMGWAIQKGDGPPLGTRNAQGGRDPVPMDAQPGLIGVMPKGWEFQGWDPQHPTTAFATFHAAMIRRVAAGLCISYTSLANDPGDANYSSSRSAILMEQRFWRKIQQLWVRQVMQPIYDEWLRTALLTGDLDLGFAITDAGFARLRRVHWEVPGWDWIDPEAEVQAAVLAIDNHLDSHQRIAGARGLDWEDDVVTPQQEAAAMLREAGLAPAPADAPGDADTPTSRTNGQSASSTRSARPAPSRNGDRAREAAGVA